MGQSLSASVDTLPRNSAIKHHAPLQLLKETNVDTLRSRKKLEHGFVNIFSRPSFRIRHWHLRFTSKWITKNSKTFYLPLSCLMGRIQPFFENLWFYSRLCWRQRKSQIGFTFQFVPRFFLVRFVLIMALMWNDNECTNNKSIAFNIFQQYVASILAPPCQHLTSPKVVRAFISLRFGLETSRRQVALWGLETTATSLTPQPAGISV